MSKSFAASLGAFAFLLMTTTAHAVIWNESTDGDLSSNPSAPTSLGTFAAGTHPVTATSTFGEQDDITFTIPAGLSLSSVVPSVYSGGDGTAFIGIASGSTIPNQGLAPGNLLGYAHFGPGMGNLNTDILDDIAAGPGALGFTPPLGPGAYSVWMQQAGSATTFQMDFVVTPEPASLTTVALAGVVVAGIRRRTRPATSG